MTDSPPDPSDPPRVAPRGDVAAEAGPAEAWPAVAEGAEPCRASFKWWWFCQPACRLFLQLFCGLRIFGAEHLRTPNPVMLVCNHQSYFDPMFAGMGGYRHPFYALARKTLWDTKWLGFMLSRLNGIPVDQDSSDLKAMRKCIEVLRGGARLLIFAEGSRTATGQMQPFASGVSLILKRAKPTVIPVAIEGAYDIYPIHARKPRFGPSAAVAYGKPIDRRVLAAMKPEDALRHIEVEVERLRRQLAKTLNTAHGKERTDLLPIDEPDTPARA
ncbi:MAG: lysophospholipid acyltransferase family protein [Planctomycetota bacterium]